MTTDPLNAGAEQTLETSRIANLLQTMGNVQYNIIITQ